MTWHKTNNNVLTLRNLLGDWRVHHVGNRSHILQISQWSIPSRDPEPMCSLVLFPTRFTAARWSWLAQSAILWLQNRKMMFLVATSLFSGGQLADSSGQSRQSYGDASLGYYINPLINVLLVMFFLGERLRKLQWWQALAAIGAIQLIAFWFDSSCSSHHFFWFLWLTRKKVNLEAQTGLFIETLSDAASGGTYHLLFIADTATSDFWRIQCS